MTCVVHYAPEAMEQLAELDAYIERASGSAKTAARYVEDVIAYCDGLEVFPERGTVHDDIWPELRLIGFRRRTTIAFIVDEEIVTILGVFHGGQDIRAVFRDDRE